MLFDEIQSKTWGLSASAGISPFTFLHFEIDEKMRSNFPVNYLNDYTQGIAFFLWDNYSVEDYRDYLSLSKEYLMMENEQQRNNFLFVHVAKMTQKGDHFLQWQHSQIYVALGFALNEIRRKTLNYQEVEVDTIHRFEQSLKIKGGILKEIILFNNTVVIV